MEASSEVAEERKQRVPFHGMKIYGSASPFGKLHKSKSSSPMGPLKTRPASREKAVNLLNKEPLEFDIKQEPSDFSNNDLKLISNSIDNNDEIMVLSSDFPINVKQFNWSEKRNACDPGYEYFKSKLNLNSRRTFDIKEKQGDNYMESSSCDLHRSRHVSPTDVNLCNRLEKISKCEAKAGKSLEDSCLPDDPVLFCDINDINLSNTLNEEHCLVKFKEIKKNIDKVYIKVEPCDLEVDENDSGIYIPMHLELTTNAVLKHVAERQHVKEEPCDRPSEDYENDSGIHSPMHSEISGNAVSMDKLCEVVLKKELCESDQISEPWLPWLPLDASEDPMLLRQESHEQLIKNEPLEQDLLKQIKKDLEPLCVSKKKLANKYISKYHKPQLNETGQTFNCSDCDKSFTMRNLLSHHIIYEHNTLKLLKCPICHRRFNKLNGLSNHIRATHKIRRHHICKLCHHSFSRHHYLVYHMRAIHKIVK